MFIVGDGRTGANRNRPWTGTIARVNCRRWENGGQPQHDQRGHGADGIVGDGRTGANRNGGGGLPIGFCIVGDGRTGANRNDTATPMPGSWIVGDGRTGANRNGLTDIGGEEANCRRWENGGQPQHVRLLPITEDAL